MSDPYQATYAAGMRWGAVPLEWVANMAQAKVYSGCAITLDPLDMTFDVAAGSIEHGENGEIAVAAQANADTFISDPSGRRMAFVAIDNTGVAEVFHGDIQTDDDLPPTNPAVGERVIIGAFVLKRSQQVATDMYLQADMRIPHGRPKGIDVASATALALGAGEFFHVTGTTTIESMTLRTAGRVVLLQFDAAVLITHDATDLILFNGVNYLTRAGEVLGFVSEGTGWRQFLGGGDPLSSVWGDGSDGDVTVSGTTTLTRDMYYDELVIANGGILDTAGYRVFAKTSIVINAGGIIRNNGSASTTTAGGAAAAGVVGFARGGGGGAGGNSGGGAAGSNPSSTFGGLGGAGGTGGDDGDGAGPGGAGGGVSGSPVTVPRSLLTLPHGPVISISGVPQISGGGGGGGGGGCNAHNTAGGGGGGGGVVFLIAPVITNNGAIQATGGAGANASANNGGGGGGGGGGAVVTVSRVLTAGTRTLTGGAGGNGNGTGTAGTAGSAGNSYDLRV